MDSISLQNKSYSHPSFQLPIARPVSDKKRKHEVSSPALDILDEPPTKRRKTILATQLDIEVACLPIVQQAESQESSLVDSKWVETWEEFFTDIKQIALTDTFASRIAAFCNYLTRTGPNFWQMWLVNSELSLCQQDYDSNLLSEAAFLRLAGEAESTSQYYRLQLTDNKETDPSANPLLDILISPNGGGAQLVWMQASKHKTMTGKEVLQLFDVFEEALGWRITALLDDAHGPNGLTLRKVGPLLDPQGRTMYVKYGKFKPADCDGWEGLIYPGTKKPLCWRQNAQVYNNAVKRLRSTSLATISTFTHGKQKSGKQLIDKVITCYPLLEKKKQAHLLDITQAQVVSRLYAEMRTSSNKAARQKASNLLLSWENTFLSNDRLHSRLSKAELAYRKAVTVVNETQVFVRSSDR